MGAYLICMTDFSHVLQQGAAHTWLYVPTALVLGALHGLEPGHSKTMMAAFIIAVRGTITQAVLLGLSAAFSHSLIIWLLAVVALRYGSQWNAETTEPYFQLGSAVIILALAVWMFWRTRRDVRQAAAHTHGHGHEHGHGHGHEHDHSHDDAKVIDTGHGIVNLTVFETGVPPVFRLNFSRHDKAFLPKASNVTIETTRTGGERQSFAFVAKDGFLESTSEVPEPHEFDLVLTLAHEGFSRAFPVQFREGEHCAHHHDDMPTGAEFQDAHEAAHALDIQRRFANRQVTTGQIILFGLAGGLLPCPAAFTVLLVCMQVKQFTLGFALVAAFSLGLAITMVTVGAAAAWSVGHAQKKWSGFGDLMRRAPYFSCAVLILLACYMAWHGWQGISAAH